MGAICLIVLIIVRITSIWIGFTTSWTFLNTKNPPPPAITTINSINVKPFRSSFSCPCLPLQAAFIKRIFFTRRDCASLYQDKIHKVSAIRSHKFMSLLKSYIFQYKNFTIQILIIISPYTLLPYALP